MSKFRMMLLGTVAVGLTAAAAPASAGEVEKKMTVKGQVNRVVIAIDDGANEYVAGEDNDSSGSNIKFDGSAKSETLTVKAHLNVNFEGANAVGPTVGTTSKQAVSYSWVSLANDMGELRIGEVKSSNKSVMGTSLGNYGQSGFADPVSNTLGFNAVGSDQSIESGGSASGVTLGTVANTFGNGAVNAIKYISPKFNGFQIGADISSKNNTDSAIGSGASGTVTYNADYDGTKVKAVIGAGTHAASSTSSDGNYSGAVAVKLASGLNAAVAYGKQDLNSSQTGRSDPDGLSVQIGYDAKMIDAGTTSFQVLYYEINDNSANGDKYESTGVNIQQSLSDYGTTIYGGVRQWEYTTTATKYQDITAGWVGVKVAF